ncbi:MAG: sulfatase-like hydrolase/transferase [Candidatus Eremiobacteraeota bacterium]|nr:sulfatase-like hydrolase/transferase [Candidatus Eremiobacteraeota bacterium]MCW5867685.1 sulfatase-like hydrolase/transferase [Candidatus Eremiobacteraeota bacterium]
MNRREFLQAFAASAALGLSSGCGGSEEQPWWNPANPDQPRPPHLILVTVDQLRYPVHLPAGVADADAFMQRFMPNTYRHIWRDGVKFANHQIAAAACTPSRAVMLTGLYAQQTWVVTTITGNGPGGDVPPGLDPAFPTYGKLLRLLGYQTPFFGKFHVSADYPLLADACTPGRLDYLEPWGFQSFLCPDLGGSQGQGEGGDGSVSGDEDVADLAIGYLSQLTADSPPVCATISFVNPHDYEFFWGGTEPDKYAQIFAEAGAAPLIPYDTNIMQEANPPAQGFPSLPSNWEHIDTLSANKPKAQVMFNEANQVIFSGVSFDSAETEFKVEDSPTGLGTLKKGVAPFSYWQRGQDCYVSVIQAVDVQIGRALDAIPEEVRQNCVIVFTSDHGDYVGSHGFLQNKVGTAYAEALRVPLVVRDHTGRFAAQTELPRQQLTSSVDLLRLLVDLGNNGRSDWMQGDLATLYSSRHDLLGVVRSSSAPGRESACFTSDEFVQRVLNFNLSPTHIMAMLLAQSKLVTYSFWAPTSTRPVPLGREVEFYDYTSESGREELNNQNQDPQVEAQLEQLFNQLLPNEVRKPLPASLTSVQSQKEQEYIAYASLVDDLSDKDALANIQLSLGGGL